MILHTPLTTHICYLPYVSNLFPPFLPHFLYTTFGSAKCLHNANINYDICIICCPHHCIATFKTTTFYTPHWGETFLYPIVLRRRSQLLIQELSTGVLPPQGSELIGFIQQISMSQPFSGDNCCTHVIGLIVKCRHKSIPLTSLQN
jgi:hypothetical protein